jgi:hypothetical protein
MRREIAYSASTALVFSLVGTGVVCGFRAGILPVYRHVAEHGWGYFAPGALATAAPGRPSGCSSAS